MEAQLSQTRLLLALISVAMTANCLPINERWKAPCGTPLELISDIILKLKEGLQFTNQTHHSYAIERIQDPSRIVLLNGTHLEGFTIDPVTEELISSAIKNKTWWHLKAYKDLSTAVIFLEQAIHNETTYAHDHQHNYIERYTEIDDTISSILCKVKMVIVDEGHMIRNYQSRDIMLDSYRTMSNIAYQHSRDFIVIKDIHNTFHTILQVYQKVFDSI